MMIVLLLRLVFRQPIIVVGASGSAFYRLCGVQRLDLSADTLGKKVGHNGVQVVLWLLVRCFLAKTYFLILDLNITIMLIYLI